MPSLTRGGLRSAIFLVALLDPGRQISCTGKRPVSPNVPPGFSSWWALLGRLVVIVAQCRLGPVWKAQQKCEVPADSVSSGVRP